MPYESFLQMVEEVQNNVQDKSASRKVIIQQTMNRCYREIGRRQWPHLWASIEGLEPTLHTDTSYFQLPRDCDTPEYLGDNAGMRTLEGQDPFNFWSTIMGIKDQAGEPVLFSPIGSYCQHNLRSDQAVTDKEQLHIVSTDAADVGQIATIRYFSEPSAQMGQPIEKIVKLTLNGTTVVNSALASPNFPASGLFCRSMSLDAACAGEIRLYETTVPGYYATCIPGQRVAPQIVWMRLFPKNTSNNKFTLHYRRRVEPMRDDGDVPLIPVTEYLIEVTTAKILEQMGQYERGQVHKSEAGRILEVVWSAFDGQGRVVHQAVPRMGSFGGESDNVYDPRGVNP